MTIRGMNEPLIGFFFIVHTSSFQSIGSGPSDCRARRSPAADDGRNFRSRRPRRRFYAVRVKRISDMRLTVNQGFLVHSRVRVPSPLSSVYILHGMPVLLNKNSRTAFLVKPSRLSVLTCSGQSTTRAQIRADADKSKRSQAGGRWLLKPVALSCVVFR